MKKEQKYEWTENYDLVLEELKCRLISTQVFVIPNRSGGIVIYSSASYK